MFQHILDIVNGMFARVIGLTTSTERVKNTKYHGKQRKKRMTKTAASNNNINTSMSNIIQFPTSKINVNSPNLSDTDRDVLLLKEKITSIEQSLEYVTTEAVAMVHRLGFDITREDYVKDVTLIVDAIRGLMYRTSGLDYPIHKWVDEAYEMDDDNLYAYNPEWFDKNGELKISPEDGNPHNED